MSVIAVVLSVEKSGRAGKTVTVIRKLPKNRPYLSELAGMLKNRCGSGGTFHIVPDGGAVEIQGDKRNRIRNILAAEGMQVKG